MNVISVFLSGLGYLRPPLPLECLQEERCGGLGQGFAALHAGAQMDPEMASICAGTSLPWMSKKP